MPRFGLMLIGLWAYACATYAALPDSQVFPATGERLLLWMASEHGRSEAELDAARKLATQGVEVWSLDSANAYFLPPLPSSMDALPVADVADWLRAAQASGKQVTVVAVSRAAVPVLRGAALLPPERRKHLCVVLVHPNLYTDVEPMADPDYLPLADLSGLQVRVLQPRRSAATPWLAGLLDHLMLHGADVTDVVLENLRENWWARETPTAFEQAESRRLDALLLRQLTDWGCK